MEGVMIKTHEEFESAFEQVLEYIAHPPAPGGPDDERFRRLLEAIAQYGHCLPQEPADHPAAVAFAALEDELADFCRRYPGRLHNGEYSGFGFGRDVRGEAPGG
jgi:hypothetical protein